MPIEYILEMGMEISMIKTARKKWLAYRTNMYISNENYASNGIDHSFKY